jgi:hypothetical protein
MKFLSTYRRAGWRLAILLFLTMALLTVAKPSKVLAAFDPCTDQCGQQQVQCERICRIQLVNGDTDPFGAEDAYDACMSSCEDAWESCFSSCP